MAGNVELLGRLEARLGLEPGSHDHTLEEVLTDAHDMALAYTGRDALPDACNSAVVRIAAITYARLGIEGEASHSEGGVSISMDAMPEDVKAMLRPYRVARTV